VTLQQRLGTDPVFVWDLAEGKLLRSFLIDSLGFGASLVIDPTGKTLAVGGNNPSKVRFYDLATGKARD
jgi:hypothetical protein